MKNNSFISIVSPFTILCAALFLFTPSCVAFTYHNATSNKAETAKSSSESEGDSAIQSGVKLDGVSSNNYMSDLPNLTAPEVDKAAPASSAHSASSASSSGNKIPALPIVAPVVVTPSAPASSSPAPSASSSSVAGVSSPIVGDSSSSQQPCIMCIAPERTNPIAEVREFLNKHDLELRYEAGILGGASGGVFNQTNQGRTLDSTNNVLGNVGGMVGLSLRDRKHYLYLSTFVSGAVDLGNIGYTTVTNSQSFVNGSVYTFAPQTSDASSFIQKNHNNYDGFIPVISDGVKTYAPDITIQSNLNKSTAQGSTTDAPLYLSDRDISVDGIKNDFQISYSLTHGTNATPPSSTTPTVETNIPLNGTVSIDVTPINGDGSSSNNYTINTVLQFEKEQNQFFTGNTVTPFAVNHTISMPTGKDVNISGTDNFGHYIAYGYRLTTFYGTHNTSYNGHEIQVSRDVDLINFYPSNGKHDRGAVYGTTTITSVSGNETKTIDVNHNNSLYSPYSNVYTHGYDSQNGETYQNRTTITTSSSTSETQQNKGSVGPVISGNIALNQRVGLMHDKLIVGDFQFIPYAVGAVGVAFSDSVDPFFGEGLGGLVSFDKIKAVKIGTFVEVAAIQMIGTGVQAGYANFGAAARAGVQFGV